MADVAVLAPVLARPQRVVPLVESFMAAISPHRVRLYPICSLGDREEIAAWAALMITPVIVEWEPGPGDWARKINFGFRRARHQGFEFILLGADDLRFHPGWIDAALHVYEQTDCCVIGTNDLGNTTVMRGRHSTHPLVHADYLDCGTADEDDRIVHEGYGHQYVDTEFIETAQARRNFAFAADCHVEHLHPFWGKGTTDATYDKGMATAAADRALYLQRKKLWS